MGLTNQAQKIKFLCDFIYFAKILPLNKNSLLTSNTVLLGQIVDLK